MHKLISIYFYLQWSTLSSLDSTGGFNAIGGNYRTTQALNGRSIYTNFASPGQCKRLID